MTGLPKINKLFIAAVAILLAIWGQRRLALFNEFDALALYGLAAVLFLWTFRTARFEGIGHGFTWPNMKAAAKDYLRLIPNSSRIVSNNPALTGAQKSRRQRAFAWLAIGLGGLIALGANGRALWLFHLDFERPQALAWPLYVGSIALFLAVIWLLDLVHGNAETDIESPETPPAPHRDRRWLLGALMAILVVGAFMRLYRFSDLPFGTWYDEAAAGLLAQRMQNDPNWRPVFPGSINVTAHYIYLVYTSFKLFGISTQAVRAVSVLMGLAAIPAAYLLGRELYGRTLGLGFALVVAVARWHVNFSRIGMYNIATPLFELLAAGFLLRGIRRNRFIDFGLAGLALGLGLCFYPAFQLFVAALGLFVFYLLLTQRGFWQRYWSKLLLMTLLAAMIAGPLVYFAYEKPDVYFARTQDTSLWAKTAPEKRVGALLENTRKHLLMFQQTGDPNGRHNIPGAPMLDTYTAALMVLGVLLALRWVWRPRGLLLLLWLLIPLLGGILSLDFEAPQSLRSIGSLPAAYLLAMLPLYFVRQEWRQSVEGYFPRTFVWPLLLLLIPIAYSNYYDYFQRWAYSFPAWSSFSTAETLAAQEMNGLNAQTDIYLTSFFAGHPAINFLTQGEKQYTRLDTTARFPLPLPPDKVVVMIFNTETRDMLDDIRRLYPNAAIDEIGPPFGGPPVLFVAHLTPTDIANIEGLMGAYYPTDDWSGPPALVRQDATLRFDWRSQAPLAMPFSVEWEGVLHVETYGEHRFFVQAPAYMELYIGEEKLISGEGDQAAGLVLAKGDHAIRLRAVGGPGPLSLSWRPPDRDIELVPSNALYVPPVTNNGLLGSFYANDSWTPPISFAQIDARFDMYFHVPALPRPYTVEWTGKIAIPQTGNYYFGLESIDESTLNIDGQEVVSAQVRNQLSEKPIALAQGLHDIRIRYRDRTDHTHINFFWTPPGGTRQIVPEQVLFPPQANYARVSVPDMRQLLFDPDRAGAPIVVSPQLDGDVHIVQRGLNQPKGIAVGPDGSVYVTEMGARQLLVLSPDGEVVRTVTGMPGAGGEEPFVEPFDVAVDGQGQVYVLDAGAARLPIFAPNGDYLRDAPGDPLYFDRTRGLTVDTQNRLWLAATAWGSLVAENAAGEQLFNAPVWPGEDSQPVDVAIGAGDHIFVVDANLHKLIHFDASGQRLLAWELTPTNTLDAPHMAVDDDGFVYLSEPENSRIAQLDPTGERVGEWLLMSDQGAPVKPIGVAVDGAARRVWYVDTAFGEVGYVERPVGE